MTPPDRTGIGSVRLQRVFRWVTAAIVVLGIVSAELAAWTCDDAFISARYARNLVEGHGLVFNPGERVEGYTNLSWTLLLALGLRLGIPLEAWMVQLGVASFACTLLLLAYGGWRRHPPGIVPIAALVTVAHHDTIVFATSGLETALLGLLILGSFLLLEADLRRPNMRGWPAGLVLGLAVATRPDALLFATAGLVAFGWARRPHALARYGAGMVAVIVPLFVWRWGYYGELLPNTYYAKSAGTPWWSQGWHYLSLYLEQYIALTLGLLLAAVLAVRRRGIDRLFWAFTLALAAGIFTYVLAIVRVGGDFMFARLFVPLTPLCAVLLERNLVALAPGRTVVHLGIAAGVVASMHLLPRPVSATTWRHGVSDEWAFYDERFVERSRREADALGRAVEHLDVRIAFLGGMARVIDDARVPYAVDAETGLTDHGMARRPLQGRGRPGHEKRALVGDLLERRIHFVVGNDAAGVLGLAKALPVIPIEIGELDGVLIHWDPEIVEALRARGAVIRDFPRELDEVLARLPDLDDAQVRSIEERVRRFYLDHVDDPTREAAFASGDR